MSAVDDWNDLDDYLLGMGVNLEDGSDLCHSSVGLESIPIPLDMFNENTNYPQDDYESNQKYLSLHNYAYFILKGSNADKISNNNVSLGCYHCATHLTRIVDWDRCQQSR